MLESVRSNIININFASSSPQVYATRRRGKVVHGIPAVVPCTLVVSGGGGSTISTVLPRPKLNVPGEGRKTCQADIFLLSHHLLVVVLRSGFLAFRITACDCSFLLLPSPHLPVVHVTHAYDSRRLSFYIRASADTGMGCHLVPTIVASTVVELENPRRSGEANY